MKQRVFSAILAVFMLCSITACGQKAETSGADAPTWQEQYDLGIRYLSEGNYQEAIIAFTAAIEIDPKRAEAYVSLADTYLEMGDTERANAVLQDALGQVNDPASIEEKLAALNPARPALDGYPKTERREMNNGENALLEYDQYGNCIAETYYGADGSPTYQVEWAYGSDGTLISKVERSYDPESAMTESYTEYDDQRRITNVLENWVDGDKSFFYTYHGGDITVDMTIESEQYGTVKDTFTYTLNADAHCMSVGGMGYSADGIEVNHVMEYDEWGGIIRDVYLNE